MWGSRQWGLQAYMHDMQARMIEPPTHTHTHIHAHTYERSNPPALSSIRTIASCRGFLARSPSMKRVSMKRE